MDEDITVEEANDLADEILLRDEFIAARDPGSVRAAVDRVFEAIGDLLERVFSIFGGTGLAGGAVFTYIIFALVVVLLAAVLVLVGVAIARALGDRAGKGGSGSSTARVVFDEVVDPATLRAALAQQRQSGDWRGAVISAFRLSVLHLIDDGIAAEKPGATTGDFGRAIQKNRGDLGDVYEEAVRPFERAFYSDQDVEESDLQKVIALLDRLERVGAT